MRFHNPLEQFKVETWIPIKVGPVDISLSNAGGAMIIAVALILLLSWMMTRKLEIVPKWPQAFFETVYSFVEGMIKDSIGAAGKPLIPFIFSLFIFIFFGNALGLFPYSFTFTSNLTVVGSIALVGFLLSMVLGVYHRGLSWFHTFMPRGVPWLLAPIIVPIEIISFLARPFSLTVRLVMNMIVGHIMLEIVAGFVIMLGVLGFVPLIFTGVLILFELAIGLLQAYIYSILTCIYLSEAFDETH